MVDLLPVVSDDIAEDVRANETGEETEFGVDCTKTFRLFASPLLS